MRNKGPILTLAAGLVIAAVLMVMNMNVTRQRDAARTAAEPAQTGAAAPTSAAPAPTTPPPPEPLPPATYAGGVSGGGATVAVATKDGAAIAYVCDGRSVESWLQGTATDAGIDLTGSDGASLTARYDDGVVTGTISAEGRTWEFAVEEVRPPSGLYRATANVRDAEFVGGWIVVDGEQVGLGTLAGTVVQVPPVDLGSDTVTIDGTTVDVATVDGTRL